MRPDDLRSLLVSLALAGAAFAGDTIVPLGSAYAVTYTIIILTTLSSPKRWVTNVLAAVATFLIILSAFLDPPFTAPSRDVLVHRAFALAAIWTIALIIVHHKKVAAALRFNENHKAAILDNMRVAFIEMDEAGRIVTWNPHAQELFGWSREEAVGRDLAETIVPGASRAAHRRWRESFLLNGDSSILNRWVEIDGLRRDGETFQALVLMGALKLESGGYRFFAFLKDITKRKRIARELKASHSLMRSLAGRLISSHEEERRRLARHLHDDVSQRVAVFTMELSEAEESSPPEIRESLQSCRVQAEELAAELHAMSHRLHPAALEQLGLVTSVQNECIRFQEVEGIGCSFSSDVQTEAPFEIALAAYRIVQEALRNAARHAQAQHVKVRLTSTDGRLQVSIADDGVGFDVGSADEKSHLGLLSMKERTRGVRGRITVTSQPGQGTRVEMEAPLSAAPSSRGVAARTGAERPVSEYR